LAVVAVALRRDAVYALILFTVLAVAFYRPAGQADHARKARKALAVTLISASVAGGLLDPVLYRGVMGLAEGSRIATYSLPLQQLARVYTRSPDSLSGEQIAQLESFADPAALSQYRPQLADPVMVGADERRIEQDTRAFAKLWLSVGLSHPAEYLDAAVAGTVQGWLPGAVIDAYAPPGMTSYFCYEAQIPGQDSPKGPPFVRDLYADFSFGSRTPFETPVIGLLWSPGTYLWLCVFVLAAAWPGARRGPRPGRASAAWPVALLLLASCAPVFLGPTMLVRYFLPLFYCLPLLAAFLADPRVYDLAAPARPPGYQSKAIRRAGDQKPPLP
jgi:hypothetical protein